MSIISTLFHNRAYHYEDAFEARDLTSLPMKEAIVDWYTLFYQTTPTEEEDPCQRIPYTVVNKLTKTTFGEYQAGAEDPFLRSVLSALDAHRTEAVHAAMTGGLAYLKPYPTRAGIAFSVVSRPSMLIFGRDGEGNPTDIGTAEHTSAGSKYYTLLERRTIGSDGRLTLRNLLYVSHVRDQLGRRIALDALPQYAGLAPEYTFPEPMGLGLVPIRCPAPNCVDGSCDPVAVFAAASGLIHNINRNEAQLNGEFERGQSRIVVSSDLLSPMGPDGKRRMLRDKVFVGLDESPGELGVSIFSPALRETSFLARKKEYLRDVESMIGLKRGLLSEVEAAERTATEVTSSEGDYALTIGDFQAMWEGAAREACVLAGRIGKLYWVPNAREVRPEEVTIDWGNGVLYDEDKTWQDYKDMVAAGLLKPEIAVGWRFNLPTDTPEQLAAIREKYMPALDGLLGGEA